MAAVEGKWQCTVSTETGVILRVRNLPSSAGAIIGKIPNGSSVEASKEENGWYYVDQYGGWSCGAYMSVTGGPNVKPVKQETVSKKSKETDKKKKETQKEKKEKPKKYITLDQMVEQYLNSNEGKYNGKDLLTKDLNGIYGIPYQFMETVDRRLPKSDIGQVYADRLVSRMPLLLLTPGKVNFMRDYKSKLTAAQTLMSIVDKVNPLELDEAVNGVGRYYTFDFDYVNYYGCVNQMIAAGAKFLGIQDVKVNVTGKWQKLGSINWAKAGNTGQGFKGIISDKEYIGFYIDSSTQISENLSNSTTESQLSSTVNSFSDTAREIQFLLGNTGTLPKFMKDEDALKNAMNKVDDIAHKYLSDNKLLSDIGKQFSTVALGGKLLFPEIWSDSSFTKSYNIQVKLRTPDGDKLSWFLNIYVPLCHLVCMTAPIQAEAGVSGYTSPFLVRASYRGLINCEMGMITGLNITKGKEGAWTIDGLPTEVDVDVELKDLYSALSITKENNPGAFCNNLCLVGYIANTCGININEPDFTRQLSMYAMLKYNKYRHFIPNVYYTIQQELANKKMTLEKMIGSILH